MAENKIDRRAYLAALSAGTGAALAGCLGGETDDDTGNGDDDDGDDAAEHGERVPTVSLTWFQGLGGKEGVGHLQRVLEEELGVEVETGAKEFTTAFEEMYNDARTWNYIISTSPPTPGALDPESMTHNFLICNAGANGKGNNTQYANCEFTELAIEQTQVAGDERRALVHEADSIISEDVGLINLFSFVSRGAYRTDQIELGGGEDRGLGENGVGSDNPEIWYETRPIGDAEAKVAAALPSNINTANYMTLNSPELWLNAVFSPLAYHDGDFELTPGLATDWELSDDIRTYTFFLREDATFHNGEPVTAEDVKWTFEFVAENAAQFPQATIESYDSIEVIDDHTVEFNLTEPNPSFHSLNVPRWGIVPMDLWIDGGAEENPEEFQPDPIVGSGPYRVTDFTPSELVFLEPYEDHWLDAEGDFALRGYQDNESAFRAFEEGNVNILWSGMFDFSHAQIMEEEMQDVAEVDVASLFTDWQVRPQFTVAPSTFREFNLALSHAIDRNRVNNLMQDGGGEPHLYSSLFGETHPYYPDDPDDALTRIAESPDGDPERAREILEDAGYTWDDRGRLHYPPDKDLEPPWPEESEPSEHPEKFPCVEDLCG